MIRSFILFLSLFLFSFSHAQNIVLNWDGSTTIDYGTKKTIVPFFKNSGYQYENGSVYFRSKLKDDGNGRKITKQIWKKISEKDLFEVYVSNLTDDPQSAVDFFSDPYSQEKSIAIRIPTLKSTKEGIFRLESFTIENAPRPTRNFGSKIGTPENPLKEGTFYKIKVDQSGVFKITSKFLRDNGINPASVNPKNFRIYGNGGLMLPENNMDWRFDALQENAIQVFGEEDGVWDEQDFAIFYAQGPHGFNLYASGNKRIETRADKSGNVINIYDDHAYYFLNFDKGPGKRVQDFDEGINSTVINRYDEFQYINNDKFNLLRIGRVWVDDAFTGSTPITFTTRSPIQPTDMIKYRSKVVAFQSQGNNIEININGQNSSPFSIGAGEKREYVPLLFYGIANNITGNQVTFNYSPNTGSNPSGRFYLDYAELQYKEDLSFNNTQLNFRSYDVEEKSGNLYTFKIANASAIDQVWEVSDNTNATRKVNKSGENSSFSFGYKADKNYFSNEFVAFKISEAYEPGFIGRIENQDLAGMQNVDYLMITVPEMMGQAQRLANFYEGKYNVAVVDLYKIYNEFSSGSKDITAVRDFVTRLNSTHALKYVFLLGDTSFDFKGKYMARSDVVLSYQSEESGNYSDSFVTDDYFVMTAPQSPTNTFISNYLPNIPIGRLPAANIAEAKLLIDKTLAYNNGLPSQSTPFGEWRMKLDFVVDDDFDSGTPFHNTMNQSLVSVFEAGTERKEYNVRKLYLDSFPAQTSAGGQRYPQVNQAISNDIGNSLYLFYFGHGGINGWAQERVLTIDQIQNFNNYNTVYSRFPLISTITCEFTLWDDPGTFSAGEQVMKSKTGGAAVMITSSRAIGVTFGESFTTIFTRNIFKLVNNDFLNLGDAFLKAKIEKGPDANHLKVNFLGDPASKLSRPQPLIQIDAIESPNPGVLRALDFVKIKGHIKKADGTLDENFSGRIAVNIFDKRLQKKTLNNDGAPKLNPVLEYSEEAAAIVKSSGTAKNGEFTVEFYIPKDINYEVGTGRLLVYGDNKEFDVYSNQPVQVGDINPAGINDNIAPNVKLYMNNTNFADGGITDQNPMLLACVTDDTGINSTGSGIGHDITLILDGKIVETVSLNDFFFSGDGNGCLNPNLADYQKGSVTYPFRNLTPGPHQLTFKVWDINNNSTTSTLNFIVQDETNQHLVVKKLLNWPNPFTNKTYVQFEHNCDDILDVNVQIFTITGKLVKTISVPVTAEPFFQGFRTPRTAIEWDGTDDYGYNVGKGTYIYKIFARSQNQDKCKGSATAVEKMVILK